MNLTHRTAAICVLVLLSTLARAQTLPGLGGSGTTGSTIVERDEVSEIIRHSFAHRIETALDDYPTNKDSSALRKQVAAIGADFAAKVRSKLIELEGDGVLFAAEVDSEISDIRDQYEQELITVVSAMRSGFAPPPLRRNFESSGKYSLALAQYTLITRNPIGNWLIFLAYVIGGLVVAWALNTAATRSSRKFADVEQESMSKVASSLGGPLYLSALSLGLHLGIEQLWIPHVVREGLRGTVDAMLVGAVFWLFWNACPGVASATSRFIRSSYNHEFDDHAENIIHRVLRMIVLSALLVVIVKVILGTSLANLLAGLGLIGLALYFILRSTLENVAASFTIFGDEPFRVDDLVIYKGEWGHIEQIGFRSTKLRTLEGHLITIPNDELIKQSVRNAGARPSIRRRFRLGLTYSTPPEKVEEAIQIVHEILADHEGMPEDQAPKVEFEAFGEYALRLLVEYRFEPPEFWRALAFDTKVNLAILRRFNDAGISIAYPTETHVLETAENKDPPKFDIVAATRDSAATN